MLVYSNLPLIGVVVGQTTTKVALPHVGFPHEFFDLLFGPLIGKILLALWK